MGGAGLAFESLYLLEDLGYFVLVLLLDGLGGFGYLLFYLGDLDLGFLVLRGFTALDLASSLL